MRCDTCPTADAEHAAREIPPTNQVVALRTREPQCLGGVLHAPRSVPGGVDACGSVVGARRQLVDVSVHSDSPGHFKAALTEWGRGRATVRPWRIIEVNGCPDHAFRRTGRCWRWTITMRGMTGLANRRSRDILLRLESPGIGHASSTCRLGWSAPAMPEPRMWRAGSCVDVDGRVFGAPWATREPSGAGLAGAGGVVGVGADQPLSSDVASGPGLSVWLGLAGLRWLVSHHG